MRVMLAVLALVGVFVFGSSLAIDSLPVLDSAVGTVLAQQPSGQVDVNVDVGEGGAWWSNPLWVAIGVIGLVLVIVLLAMAFRGGGTTVIKE